jgi:peroxiredoxin
MTTLTTTQELAEARAYYRGERIPKNALRIMDAATDELVTHQAAGHALQPGDPAPDFILPDANGHEFRLYSALADGPVVLVFYRGGWCPYCNIHLRGFQNLLPQLTEAGAQLVAISPQLPDGSLTTQAKNELTFPVLSDVGLHTARAFRIAFELPKALLALYSDFDHPLIDANGETGATALPMPATFVIREDRTIAFAHVDADYTRRSEPAEVLRVVRESHQPAVGL